jgi:histone deacetylase 6
MSSLSTRATGILYDEEMTAHKNESSSHPECPERIVKIWEKLIEDGVVACCKRIESREATEEEILYVHRSI